MSYLDYEKLKTIDPAQFSARLRSIRTNYRQRKPGQS